MRFISTFNKSAALLAAIGLSLVAGVAVSAKAILANSSAPPTCNGFAATVYVSDGIIVGGPQNGQAYNGGLNGTDGNDVIVASSGKDTVSAQGGDDVVCAGAGNDVVNGGAGTNWVSGGEGNDFCDKANTAQECEAASSEAILVVKEKSLPTSDQDFSFSAGALGTFSLDDDSDGVLSNTKTFSNVAVGNYVLAETPVAGWTPKLSCDSGVTGDLSATQATLALKAGIVTTCTFTNTKVERVPQCNDGKDNDGDGLIDLKDIGCKDVRDNDESDANPTVAQCGDGKDNDNDGLVDAKDPGCWTNQSNPNTYNPKDPREASPEINCPNPNAPVVFTGARLKFMEQLKVNDPELYASLVALVQTRNAQLARLCLNHPEIYKKLIDRHDFLLLKLADKMHKNEKDGNKNDKNDRDEKKSENDEKGKNVKAEVRAEGNVSLNSNRENKDDDSDRSEQKGAKASFKAKADTLLRIGGAGKNEKNSFIEWK